MNADHQRQPVYSVGKPLDQATAAMILIHGRDATAESILTLSRDLHQPEMAYLAPQAAGNTWYPYSFMMPMTQNEPGLTNGLAVIANLVEEIVQSGIPRERVVIAGFSQGACLAAEYVARNAVRYGGLLVFSGGLIGPPGTPRDYTGSLDGTPVFVGCSDTDSHIPVERVHETTTTLRALGAEVDERIYPGMDHTIIPDEIERAMAVVSQVAATTAE
jgi:predicted esterase